MPAKKQLKNLSKNGIQSPKPTPSSLKIIKRNAQTAGDSLEDVRSQQQAILDNIPDIAWLKDDQSRFMAVNKPFVDACGVDEENLIGMTDLDIWPKQLADKYRADDVKVIRSMKQLRVEETLVDAQGKRTWIETIKAPILNQAGKVIGTTGIARDITERKNANEALKKSQEQLRTLSAHLHDLQEEERSRLSREINEELGQILSILKFDLDWVEKNLTGNEKSVKDKIQSMSKLIAAVIEWVRRISQELRPSLLDTLGVIPAMEWELKEFQKRTGIDYKLEMNGSEVELDEQISTGLFRILQEVLSNVFLHSQAKSVNVSLNVKKSWLILSVRDNGVGIPDRKIIDKRSIGLFSIQERVRILNGKIQIIGKKNLGTIVTVELPYKWDGS
jgi:PAS domain S-box-containing protein